MNEEREVDEWDGNQHKAMMCVGCIVSGNIHDSPTVTTSCGLFLEAKDEYREGGLPKCENCIKASSPDICGFCGENVNVKWK